MLGLYIAFKCMPSLLVIMLRILVMLKTKNFVVAGIVLIILSNATYHIIYETKDGLQNLIWTSFCLLSGAWLVIRVLRGPDEVQSAGVRFSLAFGAGAGVPLTVVFVMIMRHTPPVAEVITSIAAFSNNELSPAAVGFGLGAVFTVLVVVFFFIASNIIWWSAQR